MKKYRISTEIEGTLKDAQKLAKAFSSNTVVEDLTTPRWTCSARYNGLEHGFSVQADDFEGAMAVAFRRFWTSDVASKGEPNQNIRELHLDVKPN